MADGRISALQIAERICDLQRGIHYLLLPDTPSLPQDFIHTGSSDMLHHKICIRAFTKHIDDPRQVFAAKVLHHLQFPAGIRILPGPDLLHRTELLRRKIQRQEHTSLTPFSQFLNDPVAGVRQLCGMHKQPPFLCV